MEYKIDKKKGYIEKREFLSFMTSVFDLSLNDVSMNGEQIEIPDKISKISFSVDLNLYAVKKAIDNKSNLIIVHHGLFWKKPIPIKSVVAKRIKNLLENNIGVYAIHLPLDIHPKIGNNSVFMNFLDGFSPEESSVKISLRNIKSFGFMPDLRKDLGFSAEISTQNTTLEPSEGIKKHVFETAITKILRSKIRYFSNNFNQKINKFAFVSGNGGEFVDEAIEKGIDCYITGEMRHTDYYLLKEAGIDLALCGHYNSETLGLRRLMNEISELFSIETEFISDDSQFNRF